MRRIRRVRSASRKSFSHPTLADGAALLRHEHAKVWYLPEQSDGGWTAEECSWRGRYFGRPTEAHLRPILE